MQRIYIDLDTDPRYGRAALTGEAVARLACVLGDPLDVEVVFHKSGVLYRLAASSTGVLTLKTPTARDGEPLFSDVTMTEEAITAPAAGYAYSFGGILDTNELATAAGPVVDQVELRCSIAWTEPSVPERRCVDFVFNLLNSSTRPEDTLPARAARFIVMNDYTRVLCPDGVWRRMTHFNEE